MSNSGAVKLRYERTELIRQIGETMRREAEEWKIAKADYKERQKAWKVETLAALQKVTAEVRSGERTNVNFGHGFFPSRPWEPAPPPCRKAHLKTLRTAKDEFIPLSMAQYIDIVGSEPCERPTLDK